jgi:hypothetical protein
VANRRYYVEKAKRSNRKLRLARAALLEQLKAVPCADCGVSYPRWVMQFDHVRGVKLGNVAELATLDMRKVLEEVAKCDMVCANCHAHRTHLCRLALRERVARPGGFEPPQNPDP